VVRPTKPRGTRGGRWLPAGISNEAELTARPSTPTTRRPRRSAGHDQLVATPDSVALTSPRVTVSFTASPGFGHVSPHGNANLAQAKAGPAEARAGTGEASARAPAKPGVLMATSPIAVVTAPRHLGPNARTPSQNAHHQFRLSGAARGSTPRSSRLEVLASLRCQITGPNLERCPPGSSARVPRIQHDGYGVRLSMYEATHWAGATASAITQRE